jgi:hypothetical protein
MPGSGRTARLIMAIVAIVVIAGLLASTVAAPAVVS